MGFESPTATAGSDEIVHTVAAAGAAQTIPETSVATISDLTLTAATCVLTFPSLPGAGYARSFTVVTRQDGTGSRLVTWPATVKWSGAAAPTLTTTALAVDVFAFVCEDAATWLGFVPGQDER